jgi:hypothetical protein
MDIDLKVDTISKIFIKSENFDGDYEKVNDISKFVANVYPNIEKTIV